MSRRNSLSRFSLSASNISSPIAESTKIGSPRSSEYELLGGRQYLHTEKSVIIDNKLQSVIPKSISSVDPKTYTDVQSRGLVSRIIKYHDNRKLNRSMSSSSLYNKPGEFPIVHLNKNEIRYSPKRNQIFSTTRIAPPDKSVFHANTRSSILRSGTILSAQSLEKTDEKGLRDNEPIVLSEGDIDHSRNSLDALKEISRKRINSDEIDSNDAYKKYRKEYVYDEYNSFGSKRQRESQTSPKSQNEGNVEQIVKKRMFRKNNDILSSLSSSLHINSPKRKISDLQPVTTSPRRSPVPPSAKQQCNDNNYIRPVHNDKVTLNAKSQEKNVVAVASRPPISRAYIEKEVIKKTVEQKPKLTLFNARYDTTPSAVQLGSKPEKYTNGNALENEEEDDTAGISFVKPKNNKLSLKTTNAALEQQRKTKLQMMLSFLNGDAEDEGRDEVDVTSASATPKENKISEAAKTVDGAHETQKTIQASSGGFTFGNIAATVSNTSSALTITTSINNKPIMSNQTMASSAGFSFGLASTTTASSASEVQPTPTTTAPVTSATSAGFSFGNNKTTLALTKAPTSNSSKTVSSAPTFGSFSKPDQDATSSSSNPIATSTSTFSFGQSKTPSTEAAQPAKPNTGFSFNTAAPASTASSVASTSAPTISSSAGFSFGGTTASKPATTTTSIILGNSSSTPSHSISFGVTSKTNEKQESITSQTSSPSNPWTMPKPSITGTFASQGKVDQKVSETSTAPKPVFGTSSAPATFGSTFSSFASKTSNSNEVVKPHPIFGAETGSKTDTTSIFGGGADVKTTASQSANLFSQPAFSFVGSSGNNNNQAETKSTAAPTFNFGGSTSNTAVAKTTQNTTPFAFGNSNAASNENTAKNSSQFTFGAQKIDSNRNNNNNNPDNTHLGFSFNANQAQPSFGALSTENKPSFSFGQSAATAATDSKPSFSFSQNSAPAASTTDNKPSFNFGQTAASTNADNKSNFSFNQNTAPSSAFSFKPVAASNTAGGGTNNNLNKTFSVGGGGDGKSMFGAAASNGPTEVKPFGFGGTTTEKNNTQPASSLFGGATSTPNKSFSFTAKPFPSSNSNLFGPPSSSGNNNSNNSNNNNNPASIFGGSNGATSNQPFAFGSSSSTNQQASSTPFAFGASASSTTQTKDRSSPAPFAFGSTSNTNQGKENSKPFAFGSSNSNSQPAISFGGSSSNKPTMPVFGAQQTPAAANNPFAPPPSVNPFSAGPGGSGTTQTNSYGRAIRTATRRLK